MPMVGACPSGSCTDMARVAKRFVCQSCGAVASKWSGRCESCGEWNTIVEEAAVEPGPAGTRLGRGGKGRPLEFSGLLGSTARPVPPRNGTARVGLGCRGRPVAGSALLDL